MNRRQKKKQEQKYLEKITAHVKNALTAGEKPKKETDPVVKTTKVLTERRKQCTISKWTLRKN